MLPRMPVIRDQGIVLIPVEGLREWLRQQACVQQDRVETVVDEVMAKVEANE